ncbi:hypothetical protein KRX11_01010 [Pasteurellaceae bacterium TAE3-ERU1]|nr:hypothetical protein [Pasteurellaceae bacterium TAE3-ERU1]
MNNGILLNDFYLLTPYTGNNQRLFVKVKSNQNLRLHPRYLFILAQDLDDFTQGIKHSITQAPAPKTTNQQAQFIFDLLKVHYGDDVAEKIRSYADNSRSKLRRDFEKKGLILPTGKTLKNWLKQCD